MKKLLIIPVLAFAGFGLTACRSTAEKANEACQSHGGVVSASKAHGGTVTVVCGDHVARTAR